MGIALTIGATLGAIVGAVVGYRIDKPRNETGSAWVGMLLGIAMGMAAVYFGAMLIGV